MAPYGGAKLAAMDRKPRGPGRPGDGEGAAPAGASSEASLGAGGGQGL